MRRTMLSMLLAALSLATATARAQTAGDGSGTPPEAPAGSTQALDGAATDGDSVASDTSSETYMTVGFSAAGVAVAAGLVGIVGAIRFAEIEGDPRWVEARGRHSTEVEDVCVETGDAETRSLCSELDAWETVSLVSAGLFATGAVAAILSFVAAANADAPVVSVSLAPDHGFVSLGLRF